MEVWYGARTFERVEDSITEPNVISLDIRLTGFGMWEERLTELPLNTNGHAIFGGWSNNNLDIFPQVHHQPVKESHHLLQFGRPFTK